LAPIVEFETNPIGPSFVKAHKKQMHIWTKVEKHSRLGAVDVGDYSWVENDDFIVLALKLGFQETREMCTKLGMNLMLSQIVVGGRNHGYLKKS
jgi:hypothetical protein